MSRLLLARAAAGVLASAPRRPLHLTAVASGGHHHERLNDSVEMAVGREYVSHFLNGEPIYSDRLDYPFPAIRFRKPDAEFKALREKEKGDWKNLTLDEKKKLYRYTFRATLAEFDHPNGEWKAVVALSLAMITLSMFVLVFVRRWALKPEMWYFTEEAKNKHLEMMIQLYAEPVTGVASKWDYEKNVWKG